MLATLTHLWLHLGWPLVRLLIFLGIGLLAALLIESLGWTKKLAAVARPLTRFARLPQVVGASFSFITDDCRRLSAVGETEDSRRLVEEVQVRARSDRDRKNVV